ncbi:MAG: type IV toxin-antitoxin system AbiEi family antitoxin [Candidatus Eisenbacteria bacterium]|nr:type IV toxin-antitoxin system AbiEi family antitoxin [Candidatus Eisenbacteria bacterium]
MKTTYSMQNPEERAAKFEAELVQTLPNLLPSLRISRIRRQQRIGPLDVDLVLDVSTPLGRRRRIYVEIKLAATPSRIREGLRQFKALIPNQRHAYPVLASTFLGPRAREICREEGFGYLDLAGNCFLQFEDLYLERIVDKNPFPRPGRPSSLFTPVSSRILRALLEEPVRTWKVGELAQAAQVSLGQTSNVCRRLLGEDYVVKFQGRIQSNQAGKLLDAWREQYTLAKNTQVAYYSFEREPEQLMARLAATADPRQWRYAVTSFAAAFLVAPFVRGIGTVAWYVDGAATIDTWVKALDLRPAEAGPNVILLVPYDVGVFYRTQSVNSIALVGNVQLYLDLYGDPGRGREQAEFLRKEKLGF